MVIDENIRYFFNITVRPVDGKDESHNHADDKRQTREADGTGGGTGENEWTLHRSIYIL